MRSTAGPLPPHQCVTRLAVLGRKRTITTTRLSGRSLTPRERQVFDLPVAGLQNKQIAAALDIGQRTVKLQRAKLKEKLGVASSAEWPSSCATSATDRPPVVCPLGQTSLPLWANHPALFP
jgi:DNA-binding NarL/FixJ family response regulator